MECRVSETQSTNLQHPEKLQARFSLLTSKPPPSSPQRWRREFDNVSRWVTKVNRATALRPLHFGFNRHLRRAQSFSPHAKLLGAGSEGYMPNARCSVRRDLAVGRVTLTRIEHQQNANATAERTQQFAPGDNLQPQHLVVESFCGIQILRIEHGLE